MERYSALHRRFPALYNQLVMQGQLEELGWSMAKAAQRARLPKKNVQAAFKGTAKNHTVFPLCVALGLDWEAVHNLNLKKSDFHLAAANENGSKGGSNKAG